MNANFFIRFINAIIPPGTGVSSVTVEVGNSGTENAGSDVDVTLVSPYYVNFDDRNLPPGTTYLVRNADPDVPEMIRFTIPAADLKADKKKRYTVGIKQVPNGPQVYDRINGYVTARTGTETTLVDNQAIGTITLDGPVPPRRTTPPGANEINYYFTYTQPRLDLGATATMIVQLGNASANRPRSDARFTFVTPYNVKVDRTDAAFQRHNPTYHTPADPTISDIVSVPVRKRDLAADPKLRTLHRLDIPLVSTGDGYPNRGGKGHLAAGAGDFDPVLGAAICTMNIIQAID